MTAINRTIYRRMEHGYIPQDLIEDYTPIEDYIPTEEERCFVSIMTQTAQNQLNLMLWIKPFPGPDYFPALDDIPNFAQSFCDATAQTTSNQSIQQEASFLGHSDHPELALYSMSIVLTVL